MPVGQHFVASERLGRGIKAEREGAARLAAGMWHLSPAQLEGCQLHSQGPPRHSSFWGT